MSIPNELSGTSGQLFGPQEGVAILYELTPLVTRNVVRWLKLPQTAYSLDPLARNEPLVVGRPRCHLRCSRRSPLRTAR
jgi:hypothetical protein